MILAAASSAQVALVTSRVEMIFADDDSNRCLLISASISLAAISACSSNDAISAISAVTDSIWALTVVFSASISANTFAASTPSNILGSIPVIRNKTRRQSNCPYGNKKKLTIYKFDHLFIRFNRLLRWVPRLVWASGAKPFHYGFWKLEVDPFLDVDHLRDAHVRHCTQNT